jgi:hypothetical protein
MRADIIPGSKFSDYELSDDTGKRRKLSELQAQDLSGTLESRNKPKLFRGS